jgi:hypothetical protein
MVTVFPYLKPTYQKEKLKMFQILYKYCHLVCWNPIILASPTIFRLLKVHFEIISHELSFVEM